MIIKLPVVRTVCRYFIRKRSGFPDCRALVHIVPGHPESLPFWRIGLRLRRSFQASARQVAFGSEANRDFVRNPNREIHAVLSCRRGIR